MLTFLNMEDYPRKSHFEYFSSLAYPYVGMTASLDVTALYDRTKALGASFFLGCLYCAVTAANEVPELRQRIIDGRIAQVDHCDCSHTVPLPDGTYCYCRMDDRMPFEDFLREGKRAETIARQNPGIGGDEDETELFFVSCVPWVSFTGIVEPTPYPADSNPRIVFGKWEQVGDRKKMPVNLLANHALVDGRQIGDFFRLMQENLNRFGGKA